MASPFFDPQSVTIENLEAAFAGESMAFMKYTYFAKVCRAMGDEETALAFESTASQEIAHALGHLDLLFPKSELSPARCLEFAIEGETYEYTEMYPQFRHAAVEEGRHDVAAEMDQQIGESKEHAVLFQSVLEKAAKRFAALAKVEERHANHYKAALAKLDV